MQGFRMIGIDIPIRFRARALNEKSGGAGFTEDAVFGLLVQAKGACFLRNASNA